MEKQFICGKETKRHIVEALKLVFPGIKFSSRSSYDSVRVSWTDGPLEHDVEKVLNRFQSYTRILDIDDRHEATGYEWKGIVYVGARHLDASRQLSDGRKQALIDYMESWEKTYLDANKPERAAAEMELITQGSLSGITPMDYPDLMRDSYPVIDRRKTNPSKVQAGQALGIGHHLMKSTETCTIIPFPNRRKMAVTMDSLNPDQLLKLNLLAAMQGKDSAEELLIESVKSVDEMFTEYANLLFKKQGGI
ncbi:LPD29 domain-containing protein [Paenibacillus agilis]|uniref:Large polyvalent protein associated domain-containing protein n=1 Tax=Paenibacillus agilis TaxID=3020863 RepID=A0A559IDB9_9BACL|nr:LPD29 domain-containing protein [Paenibacillus agilis]TVX85645.1 hypothetical protein FPZ44_25175 [Paenibacillus agilis]